MPTTCTPAVGVRILTGKLSIACSPTGDDKFFLTLTAAFAELEWNITEERTIAGLAATRPGRNGSRPTVMDADNIAAARARRERGESPNQIAKALGISHASMYQHPAATPTTLKLSGWIPIDAGRK
jgi:DNA invertase Pin-like site-specific DNA recombinase